MSINRWMDKADIVYIHNGILPRHKKWNNAISSSTDGPKDYQTKWSKPKTNIIWYHLYVESKTNDTNELNYETETDSQTERMNLRFPGEKCRRQG